MRRTRCLMPARGWYEWQEKNWDTGEGLKVKRPHFLHDATEDTVAIAGLDSVWKGPAGNEQVTCALLTRAASPRVAGVHDRMPVILRAEQFGQWLDPAIVDPDFVKGAVSAARTDFEHHPVSTQVNSAKNQGAHLVDRMES